VCTYTATLALGPATLQGVKRTPVRRQQSSQPSTNSTTSGNPFGDRITPRKPNRSATPPVTATLNEFQLKKKELEDMKVLGAVMLIQAYVRGWKVRRALRGPETPNRRWSWDGNRPVASASDEAANEGSRSSSNAASRHGSGSSTNGRRGHHPSASSVAVPVSRNDTNTTSPVGGTSGGQDPLVGTYVRAVAAFAAREEGQLSYAKGDVFYVLKRAGPKGWYEVELVDRDNVTKKLAQGAVARSRIAPYKPRGMSFVARSAPGASEEDLAALHAQNKLIAYVMHLMCFIVPCRHTQPPTTTVTTSTSTTTTTTTTTTTIATRFVW
jgi:hypothetical protein